MKVAVVGGSGFIGRGLIKSLLEAGFEVTAISRKPDSLYELFPGRVKIRKGDVLLFPSIAEGLREMDVVVNCVGIIREKAMNTFENIHIQGVINLVNSMKVNSIPYIVHISACGVGRNIPTRYFQTKEEGEKVIEESGLEYCVLRPSIVIDRSGGFYAEIEKFTRFIPFIVLPDMSGGVLQPLALSDLARLVVKVIKENITGTFEIGGPFKMSMEEVIRRILKSLRRRNIIVKVPVDVSLFTLKLLSRINGWLPITYEQYRMTLEDTSPKENALEKFGIVPAEPLK